MTERSDRNGWQANLPPRWLNDSTYRGLTVNAWTLHTWTLTWGVGQENDGYVKTRDLPFIASPMLSRSEAEAAADELVAEGIWTVTTEGYRVVGWELSQVTAAEIAEKRKLWRAKNDRRKPTSPPKRPPETNADTPGVPDRKPESNEGLQVGKEGQEGNERHEGQTSKQGWPTAQPPAADVTFDADTGEVLESPDDPGYCRHHGLGWPCKKNKPECERASS